MKRRRILIVLLTLIVSTAGAGRRKRDLNQFSRMIYMTTGRDPFDFSEYGNWCGLGGNGSVVDAIDECCFHHDNCYDGIIANPLCESVYIMKYNSGISNRTIECYDESPCEKALCNCDRTASFCFQSNRAAYNASHKGVFAKLMSKVTQTFYN
ncbi:acidic phospholipase A2 Cc1-PLA2-like [Ostrea edulis]|uniref:acidic phospholipase A2 Cc1-PLA2-like n=1 Tax=Ostrea edulis TaxID=37623 RepID=UPI0020961700|nr:acidic phospholipase A2 Cc1-PLA2-like [Ostrea edulis]XP_048735402.1 acidic phospholipase A2 Cc1-PLA2-like [Ostrea edulis]XP_048735414.1 acidic phospholipase A2 Cc1-PLA2-like [Ostrea edulis]XP_056009419.1 acidic phospholipase A2 Cc1-PLA2-like [Ostrea edulis]XP_056009425.1 acidic phospholipase A2 Cc1-PLA2-like [Ostrea edulis]